MPSIGRHWTHEGQNRNQSLNCQTFFFFFLCEIEASTWKTSLWRIHLMWGKSKFFWNLKVWKQLFLKNGLSKVINGIFSPICVDRCGRLCTHACSISLWYTEKHTFSEFRRTFPFWINRLNCVYIYLHSFIWPPGVCPFPDVNIFELTTALAG